MQDLLQLQCINCSLFTYTAMVEGSSFVMITSCVCEGQEVIFECAYDGYMTAGTYWRGSALQTCENGEILVRHSQFHEIQVHHAEPQEKLMHIQFHYIYNHSYTSQLVITNVTAQLAS